MYVLYLVHLCDRRNLEFMNKSQVTGVTSVDPEMCRGELLIVVPSEAQHIIQEGKPLRVGVEFSLEKPQSGLHFVVPSSDGTLSEVCIIKVAVFLTVFIPPQHKM